MERLEELNRLLVKKGNTPMQKNAIVEERKRLMNETFEYLPEQMEIIRKTNEHLIRIATRAYHQIKKMESYIAAIDKKNREDGFSELYITGEVSFYTSIAMCRTDELSLPTAEIGGDLFVWKKEDRTSQLTLKEFLYRPFPQENLEKSGIYQEHLKPLEPLCYGMYQLLFQSGYSLQDIMEKMLFTYEIRLHTSKLIAIEDIQ